MIPYLIWSCVYLTKDAIFGSASIKHVIYALVAGQAATPFYYIVVLMQLTLLTPCLVNHRKSWMSLITPAYLIFIYVYNIAAGRTPLLYETLFPAWFFFYLMGMDCKAGKFDKMIEKVNVGWIIAALMLSLVEAFVILKLGCADGFASSQIKISSFLYAAIIALWLQKKEKSVEKNCMYTVGDLSYGIFYVHMLILWLVRKILDVIKMNEIWIIYFGLTFIFTSILSVAWIFVIKKTAKKLKCERLMKYIGFV